MHETKTARGTGRTELTFKLVSVPALFTAPVQGKKI